MKKIALVSMAAAILLSSSLTASAEELWNPHLRGTNEGLVAGELPPKGVYFINDMYFVQWKEYDGSGKAMGPKLDAAIDIPIILWNPGIKVLDADYAVAIAQPFDYTSVYSSSTPMKGNGHLGTYNTVVVPAILSWSLPSDFFVSTSLSVYVDNASSASGKYAPRNNGAGAGNGFWTLEPSLGVSWVHDGWNVSADFRYDYNFENETTHVSSGNMIVGDYTVTKTLNKWTVGIGGYSQNQLERDQYNGTERAGTVRLSYGVGPIVGYNFGPVSLQATYNQAITTHHDFGGNFVNLRLVAPLY